MLYMLITPAVVPFIKIICDVIISSALCLTQYLISRENLDFPIRLCLISSIFYILPHNSKGDFINICSTTRRAICNHSKALLWKLNSFNESFGMDATEGSSCYKANDNNIYVNTILIPKVLLRAYEFTCTTSFDFSPTKKQLTQQLWVYRITDFVVSVKWGLQLIFSK